MCFINIYTQYSFTKYEFWSASEVIEEFPIHICFPAFYFLTFPLSKTNTKNEDLFFTIL